MIVKRGKGDFTQVYRPCRISEVVGNDEVKRIIERAFKEDKVPHNFLFHGLSGTGKTTIARIIQLGLNCVKGLTSEPCCECWACERIIKRWGLTAIFEFNAVEVVKDQLKEMLRDFNGYNSGQIEGLSRNIFLVDECHGLTDQQASLFLKYTEDVPIGNYFIFCTTNPDKFLHTLRNRCTIQVEFKKVPDDEIMKLLSGICEQENIQHDEDVLKGIVDQSGGMPRNAVNLLQSKYLAGNLRKNAIHVIPGSNNILVIAPHGHPHDDVNSGEIASRMHENLGCYAVINDEYRKPKGDGSEKPDIGNRVADLNLWGHIKRYPELKNDFLAPIENFKDEILAKHQTLHIIHIHGIDDKNILHVAKIAEDDDRKARGLHALVGHGQWANDNSRVTADAERFVHPFIEELGIQGLKAAIAPTEYIIGTDGKKKWYCGNDRRRLNQKLSQPRSRVQSIQIEVMKRGFREDKKQARKTADRICNTLLKTITDRSDEYRFSRIEMRKLSTLRPHPLNQQIYGATDPDDDLKVSIQGNGILTPLLVSYDDRVLSGHRRFACAEESGIEDVPVIVSPLTDELDIEEALINANIQRQKTKEQIAREYAKLKEIEAKKAKQRQAAAGGDRKSDEYRKSLVQNFAQAISTGKSRNKASSKLGVSHHTAEKAAKVVHIADELKMAGKTDEARALIDILNKKSVDRAHKEARAIEGELPVNNEEGKSTFNKTTDSVEWATWTWNPVTGCEHGCKYCYAREMVNRFDSNFPNSFKPTFYPERLDAPSNTRLPASKNIGDRSVFVVSMGDLFGDWVDQEWIDAVLESVRKYPQWNYLFLTKNPKRLVDIEWPDNAWVGTTVDCQERVQPAEEAFEKINAKIKFLSCEPLSEELTFTNLKLLDWVIIGARSQTSGAPAMQPKREWVQSLMRQAWDAGCMVYCKPNLKAGVKEYPLTGPPLKDKVKPEDNPEPKITAPVIMSASRRTDIPAFHSKWFMERLRQGRVIWENPYNRQETISSFDETRLIVFWTKNPVPLFDHLDEIDSLGFNYYFQFTLNDYDNENLEMKVPPLVERIDAFQQLSKRIGKERVVWRFDPLILTDAITKEKLLEKVYGIGKQLSGFTEKLVFSFARIDEIKKVKKNLDAAEIKYRYFSDNDINYLAGQFGRIGGELGIEVAACATKYDLSSFGISKNKCIDDGLIKKVFSHDKALMEFVGVKKNLRASGQQKHCGCIKSTDIGHYDTCKHFCLYCYANKSEKAVKNNFKRINNTSERLLPKKRS